MFYQHHLEVGEFRHLFTKGTLVGRGGARAPVVHKQFLNLLVMTTSVSLVVQGIMTYAHSTMLIICAWDGGQCGTIEGGCCRAAGLPWFHKTLSTSTSDYIELRLYCDQPTSDEDVPISLYEIYVK